MQDRQTLREEKDLLTEMKRYLNDGKIEFDRDGNPTLVIQSRRKPIKSWFSK